MCIESYEVIFTILQSEKSETKLLIVDRESSNIGEMLGC